MERPDTHPELSHTRLTIFEKTVFFLVLTFLTAIFVIAVWSGILLFHGAVEGGGPLGIIMEWCVRVLTLLHAEGFSPDMQAGLVY